MNILFPLIKADSGSDVFTRNLVSGLNKSSITADIHFLHPWSGFFPPLAGRLCDYSGSDVIHANTWNGFAFKNERPLITTEYHIVKDPLFEPYKTRMQRFYHALIYQYEKKSLVNADAVTCISRYTQKMLEKTFGYSDSKMIYCGIDTDMFKPIPNFRDPYGIEEGKTILLYVGNLSRRKGADLLIPIMNRLGEQFILLTTTGLRATSVLCHNNIISLGKLSLNKLVNSYNLCDMLLFPSRLEGFGLCVAEAMACGKPVVTTNCSSLPELVKQDKGGILCEMNDVSRFAEAIRYLAGEEELRLRMGRYNRQRVEDMFTAEEMTEKYVSLYQKIV